jgi:signal transduction histidine kinase/CheY-like chemotaxis protein
VSANRPPPTWSWRDLAVLSGILLVYVTAGRLSLELANIHVSASAVWPPTGIALASLVLFGVRMWPAILAGALLVNIGTQGWVGSAGIAAGNTLEAVVGAFLVNRYAGGRRVFEHAQDIFTFCGLVVFVSAVMSATIGVTTLTAIGSASWADYSAIWLTWWLGDTAGGLIVTPLILIWVAGPHPRDLGRRGLEAAFLAAAIIITGQAVFGGWLPAEVSRYPIAFVTLPVLVWAGYRFEQAGAAASIALLAVSAIPGTLNGAGPFAVVNRNDALLLLQAFLATMAVTVISLAALVHGSKQSEQERERLALEATRLYGEAEAANRAKDEFLATLSHELRTPLNAMLGWTAVLRQGSADRAITTRALDAIERNTRIQAQLIDDLLDVSRIVTGKLRLELRVTRLRPVVEAALEATLATAAAKKVTVDLDLDPTVQVRGDPARLQQIVWNLMSNAVKFTPAGGRVAVALTSVGAFAQLVVRDTGVGISPATVPYLFDRFHQATAGASRGQGLGLGLAIVRQLVDLHGGTVTASSDGEGMGATFRVMLPLASSDRVGVGRGEVDRDHAAPDERRPVLAGARIVVVEDDADARELLRTYLTRSGAVVATAGDAATAMSLLAQESFDLILSDIGLPGEDGHALIRRVRGLAAPNAGIPAVAVTAYARADDRDLALAAGFQVHVAKPVKPAELVTTIAELLEKQGTGPARSLPPSGNPVP